MPMPWERPRWYPPVRDPDRKSPTPTEDLLAKIYGHIRFDLIELEELIAAGEGLDEKDLKRLDKAVTVCKVGSKLIKRTLKRHGFRELKPKTEPKPEPITYEVDFIWGSIEMGKPTGRWEQDPDGWWREVMTDTIWRDGDGKEVRREPTKSIVRVSDPFPPIKAPR